MEMNATQTASGWTLMTVTGRIDAHTSPEFETACRSAVGPSGTKFAVDLQGVQYMSSAGLRGLLAMLKELSKRQGKMALIKPQENVREVLEISGFSKIFTIVDGPGSLD